MNKDIKSGQWWKEDLGIAMNIGVLSEVLKILSRSRKLGLYTS